MTFVTTFGRYWAPVIICMLGIYLVSNATSSTLGQAKESSGILPDFIANVLTSQYFLHPLEFGVLSALIYRLLRSYSAIQVRVAVTGALTWAIAYGVLDEVHQSFVAGRQSTLSDLGLDTAGAITAIALILFMGRYLRPMIPKQDSGKIMTSEPGNPQPITGGSRDPEQLQQIVTETTEALLQDPDNAAVLFRRGNAYSNLREYENTKEDMTRVIELEPENSMAHNNKGIAYLCTGDPETAAQDITRAIELDPQYRDAYHNRGLAFSELEKVDDAIVDLTRAIELDPEFWSAYRHRSILYAMAGQQDASYRDYLKARELGP